MNINSNETKSTKITTYLLITVSIIFTINAVAFRYPIHIILPFIKALLLIFVIFIYGFSLMKLCGTKEIKFDAAFATGIIFTTFFFFLVAFFRILSPLVLTVFYLSPLPLLIMVVKKQEMGFTHSLRSFLKRPKFEYLLFFFPLVYASMPSSFFDTLVVHLGIPNLYLQHSGFIATPQFLFANTSIYYEISLIPSVFAGEQVPRLFHFLIGVILIFSITDFSVDFFKIKKRNLISLTILSIPLTVFLISTVKNDLLSAFFIYLGIKYFLNNRVVFSAIMWGFSLGVKYTNIIPMIIFLLVLFYKEKSFMTKKILIFGIVIFLVLSPILIKNYVLIHNPVYPFFYEHFKTDSWDSNRDALLKDESGGIFNSISDFLRFPYTLSYGEIGLGGLVGPIFIIFLPFLLLGKRKNNFLLLFSLILLFVGPIFKASIRCWYISFLFLPIYVVRVYESEPKKIIKFIFFTIIALNFTTAFSLQERSYRSYYLLSGKFNVEEYKSFLFPTYPAFAYINNNTPEGSKILIVGEARNYYLKRPYKVSSSIDYSILKTYLSISHSFQDFIKALKKDKVNYIIYNSREFERLQKGYKRLSKEEVKKYTDFFNRLNLVFQEGPLYVFEII